MYVTRSVPGLPTCSLFLSRALASSKSAKPTSQRHPKASAKFSTALADVCHNVPPILTRLDLPLQHELYARYCMAQLKNIGMHLKLSGNSKWSTELCGSWRLAGRNLDVQASCSLVTNLETSRSVKRTLGQQLPENTVNVIINNVGFKQEQLRKFASSTCPTLLLSVYDVHDSWVQSEEGLPPSRRRKVEVERCLHLQKWDGKVSFSTYSFDSDVQRVPESVLTRGLSLVLFNRAFMDLAPGVSAGKVVYSRIGRAKKTDLRTAYASTILVKDSKEDKMRCLQEVTRAQDALDRQQLRDSFRDVLREDRERERYFTQVTSQHDIGNVFSAFFLDPNERFLPGHNRRNSWP